MKLQFDNYHLTNAYSLWMSKWFPLVFPSGAVEEEEAIPYLFLLCLFYFI